VSTTLDHKTKRAQTANSCQIEEKKTIVLEILKGAIKNLKEARKKINKAVLLTLEMKKAGDEVANEVIAAVAEVFASDCNSWILKDRLKQFD
jgi:hypothetical protein